MPSKLRTLKDANIDNKRVLLRLDLNVPLDEKGNITDDTRIKKSLATIKYLVEHGAKVIIMSHLGRPDGKVVDDLKLDVVGNALTKELGQKVVKLHECIGPEVEEFVMKLEPGEVCLLENTRFYHQEEENDEEFSKNLSKLGELYVSDAFGTVHRAHASTVGVANFLPSYAGLLLENEINVLSSLISNPQKPLCLVIGGAKIDTKLGLLVNFLPIADKIIIGGALANTFLLAEGYEIGDSKCEKEKVDVAQNFLLQAEKMRENVLLPEDAIVSDEISNDATIADVKVDGVTPGMKILDVGKISIERFKEALKGSKTIIWNGPLGLYEYIPFENGTKEIAKEIADSNATTIIGGGDTIDAINKFGIDPERFSHISTGGGAMLEFLQGDELPGVSVLEDK